MISILLIALLSAVAQLVLPWWSIALVAFAFCFGRPQGSGRAFLYSFVGVALVWFGYAILQHSQTNGILTSRISEVLKLPANPIFLLVITPLVGGLVAGLAGLAGYFTRQALMPTVTVKS
ncbi:hypothetical protein J2I47_22610 [Fibrella sp. HMF5335]|uniref:Uncharacterized protein n=1 Tax=Fibrella rubiginis TaxID=2817060 RepID=A0A939GMX2_9BACT|nr:hypothetical protein [Fibrella rubiginis]MBO0939363.1 hypothetical protein [Fibrella rubiginis]